MSDRSTSIDLDPPSPAGAARPRSRRRPTLLLGLLALAGLVLVAGAVLAVRAGGGDQGAPAAAGAVELGAPIGDVGEQDAPRLLLRVAPARPGANAATVRTTDAAGTPISGARPPTVRLGVARLDDPAAEREVAARPGDDGALVADLPLDEAGWWRVRAATGSGAAPEGEVAFYLFLPDPNLHGGDAVETPASSAEAEAVYERGLAATTALHRLRYRQTMADGAGHVVVFEHAVNDGSDGQPPALFYRSSSGTEGYVVGNRRWTRRPGEAWEERDAAPIIPPAAWGEEYEGATGFRLGGTEPVGGERCRIVTFVVPERTEPRHRVAAWYAWWVGEESGQVRREAMVSRAHYMVNESWDFDAPLPIAPPVPPSSAAPVASLGGG